MQGFGSLPPAPFRWRRRSTLRRRRIGRARVARASREGREEGATPSDALTRRLNLLTSSSSTYTNVLQLSWTRRGREGWWDAGRWGPIVEFQNVGISVGRHDALDFKLACEVLAPFFLAAFSPFSAKKENNPNNTEVRRPGPRIDVVLFQFGLGFGFPWNVADAPSHFLVNGVLGSFMALCRALEVRLSPFVCFVFCLSIRKTF